MATTDDVDARRDRGEAELHEAIARAHDDRAAMARRIGAVRDADEAADQAVQARERARKALGRM
jgi:hypothetical protein